MPLKTVKWTAFRAWEMAYLEALYARNKAMESKLQRHEISLWNKNKEQLMALAQEELGLERTETAKLTIPEIRLELQENRAAVEAERLENVLPKGFAKLRKAQHAEEMVKRGLNPEGMKQPEMMRALREWAAAVQHYGRTDVTIHEIQEFVSGARNASSSVPTTTETTPEDFTMIDCSVAEMPKHRPSQAVKAQARPSEANPLGRGSPGSSTPGPSSACSAASEQVGTSPLELLCQQLEATAQGIIENDLSPEETLSKLPGSWCQVMNPEQQVAFVNQAHALAIAKKNNLPVKTLDLVMRI